ncbi:hypothetical protein [Pseudanabaena sp. ABRG5-3]|uniref:hypothetical protein n=1 Tax=Pseudanabaena sp. ABRG5-3 TaxID=685565 RepID=UPI000DC7123E|nr:hypothetical protein [Pseudanabaena sp. ABRG5-3]BBC26443.1 hypothetical protein ABRG53_4186 [Pseudanabaena sp. ABRG5-3]
MTDLPEDNLEIILVDFKGVGGSVGQVRSISPEEISKQIAEGASHFGTFGKDKWLKPLVLGLGKLGLRQSEMLPIADQSQNAVNTAMRTIRLMANRTIATLDTMANKP